MRGQVQLSPYILIPAVLYKEWILIPNSEVGQPGPQECQKLLWGQADKLDHNLDSWLK